MTMQKAECRMQNEVERPAGPSGHTEEPMGKGVFV